MHRPYLVLIQPQVHDSAVERRSRVKIQLRVVGGTRFAHLLMWAGMDSYGGWFMLQMASHTKPFSPSISQQSAVTAGNRMTDSRTSQQRNVEKTADEETPVTPSLRRSLPVLWAIWDAVTVSVGKSRAEILSI